MSVDKRLSSTSKIDKAAYVAVIILISLNLFSSICGAQTSPGVANPASAQVIAYPSEISAGITPVVFENLESARLVLTRPSESSLIPYDKRGFNQSVEASIAWWMNPKFADNTTEYRRYLRETDEGREKLYSQET
ncbi:MAG TPA: hypothetical protein VN455_03875 [Methanotrichaceae archaeon]|nr:hypothetical protein [Methanotrichaceae archaeon]